MNTKYPAFVAGLVLVASIFLTTSELRADAEERPMPPNTPFDPNPTDPAKSKVDRVLVFAYDSDGNKVPVKTLKITNNHKNTIYPVMRDGNEAAIDGFPDIGLYDPYDPVRREYRGYIGYQGADKKYYFGLKPGQSILVRVPLVFWNGARLGIVTEGRYLTPAPGTPNPLSYDANAETIITSDEPDPKDPSLIKNGVIMWYTAALNGPALDSPDQLVEWTIRDEEYLSNPQITARTQGKIPDSERVTLINYDVSYVDNMFMPAAMAALDVPIPAPPFPPGRKAQPFGWIGAINTSKELQERIKNFTQPTDNTYLGSYFGGKGWPIYNIPIDEAKIPAGQNVFAQSPQADARSSYNNNAYMLSSGGDINTPISVIIGGQGSASSGTTLTLSPNEDIKKVQFLQPGFTVVGRPPADVPNPIQPDTKIVSVNVSTTPGVPSTVILDKPLVASQEGCIFEFFRPRTDYASDAMIKLWYSWAKYHLDTTKSPPTQTLTGAVVTNSATLTFKDAQNNLIVGMQVTGPGLADPDPSKEKGGIVILQIADDERSVTLSQLASATHPISEGQQYTFKPPQPLPSTPDSLFTLNFSADPKDPSRDPREFAKKVYLIMASMAQIPKKPDPAATEPHVYQLMNNVIGGNMGFIFDTNAQRFSDAGLTISAFIRDMLKSVLRGVTDFTQFSEFDETGKLIWYPDPKDSRGGLTFNAFNLDPFVWFVHVELGFSGYGFSLDDDTADVGAGEATELLLTIGGPPSGNTGPNSGMIKTRENANEWGIQAPYGPVTGTGEWDPTKTQSFYLGITGASYASPIVITSEKHGLLNGEKVFIDQVRGNTNANTPTTGPDKDKPFTVGNVTQNTFELIGTNGNNSYSGGGRWTRGPLPYITFTGSDIDGVYWRVKGDDRNAGFQGAVLSGPGVLPNLPVRVVQLGDDKTGQLALNRPLTKRDGKTPLPAGKNYKWIFSSRGSITP